MQSRNEPLTKGERAELRGYITWTTVAGRVLLFVVALLVMGAVCRRLLQRLQQPGFRWLLPTIAAGLLLYIRSGRWIGGQELRRQIRADLGANAAVVHHVRVREALVFGEREDEGADRFPPR